MERCAFGDNQFAYQKRVGATDLVLFLICTCILAWSNGCNVLFYSTDVSGAFDNVSSVRLLQRLMDLNVSPVYVRLLESWLSTREVKVIVDGSESRSAEVNNMAYQGTCFGPLLWNTYFGGVSSVSAE